MINIPVSMKPEAVCASLCNIHCIVTAYGDSMLTNTAAVTLQMDL